MIRSIPAIFAALVLLGGCSFDETPAGPHTRVLVYNRTGFDFSLDGDAVPYGNSGELFLPHGESRRAGLFRDGAEFAVLAFTSLVPVGATDTCDAAVTVYELLPGEITLLEFSPWFDVALEDGR
ncbi:hypothetical protein JXB37_00210 [candidate division WOR-3 bacterium]|nr:hypothetical protein [candidate division WOR-3 bacterium]